MATWVSQRSGNWSANANTGISPWNGGGNPASGIPAAADTITVSTGHVVTYDTDNSAGAGFASVVINGTLTASVTAGTYQLKMNGNITGSGTWNIGSSGTPYPSNCQFNVIFTGTQRIVCTSGLTLAFYCQQPTSQLVQLISSTSKAITGVTRANPAVVTCVAHGLTLGTIVYLANVGGMSEISNMQVRVGTVLTVDTFQLTWQDSLVGIDSRNYTAYTSGGKVCPSQANAAADTILTVDTNITGDVPWSSTSGSKIVRVDNVVRGTQNSEERIISSLSATTVTITAGLTATKLSGARISIMNRNIRVTGSTNITNTIELSATTASVIGAELSGNSNGVGSSTNNGACIFSGSMSGGGTQFSSLLGATVSGAVSGATSLTFSAGSNNILSGTFTASISNGMGGTNNTLSGSFIGGGTNIIFRPNFATLSGYFYGVGIVLAGNFGSVMSGTFVNCGTVAAAEGLVFSGVARGCGIGFSGGNILMSGTIVGASTPFNGTPYAYISGTIADAPNAIQMANVEMNGATLSNNTVDLLSSGITSSAIDYVSGVAYNSSLGGATQYSGYKRSFNSAFPVGFWSFDPVVSGVSKPGRILAWTPGGNIVNNETPPASPPVTLAFTHQYTFEATSTILYPVYVDIPVTGIAGVPLSINVYLKKSTNAMVETPRVQLIDPSYGWDSVSSKVVDTAMADDTNWQTIIVSTTPATNKQYILRVRGQHTSGTLDWNYTIATATRSFAF